LDPVTANQVIEESSTPTQKIEELEPEICISKKLYTISYNSRKTPHYMLERKLGIILLGIMLGISSFSVNLDQHKAFAAIPTFTAITGDSAAGDSSATTQLLVTFSESVNATAADTAASWSVTGFSISTVSSIATGPCGGTATMTITLTTSMATDAVPTVTYDGSGPNPVITSCSTNEAMVDTTSDVPSDGLSPTLDSAATTTTTTIDVTYSEAMDTGPSITTTDYTITNPSVSVTGVSVSGSIVTLTVGTMGQDDTPTVAQPGSVDDTSANTLTAPSSVVASDGTANSKNGSGCSGDCQAPTLGVNSEYNRIVTNGFTYNGKSTDVERFYTPYPLITVDVGKQNKAVFKIYENYGPQNIRHFSFAFGLGGDQVISQSKAMIELDIDFEGTETVTITDPENALDNIRVKTSTGNCNLDSSTECLIVTIDHRFRTQLDFNIVGTDVWDTRRNSWQNYYNDGIEVVGKSLNPPKQYTGINDGHLITITEIGKNTAIDQKGNTWTFDKTWEMDFILNGKIDDGISAHGYDRNYVAFSNYKYGQELLAKQILDEFCPKCGIESFEEIGDVKFYRYPDTVYKLNDPVVKKMLEYENEKAMKTLQKMFDEMYNHDYKRIEPFQSD